MTATNKKILEKALENACQLIVEHLGTCPLDFENYSFINCDTECGDNYSVCWEQYFIDKAQENN